MLEKKDELLIRNNKEEKLEEIEIIWISELLLYKDGVT